MTNCPKPTNDFQDLLQLMAILRAKCPWDKKQTNDSLLKYAVEEVFELVEAVKNDDNTAFATGEIKGELGDVLLQVIFHAHLYQEQERFDIGEVIYALQEKLIRRHPHVFDAENLKTDKDVKKRWDEIKAFENQHKPKRLLSDVKAGTALTQAQNLQKKASEVNFDWQNLEGVLVKLDEEIAELKAVLPDLSFCHKTDKLANEQKQKISDELGDCLFALVNVARHLSVDSEMALQDTIAKFRRRFAYVEEKINQSGKTFEQSTLEQMDVYWEQAKKYDKNHP